MLSSMQFGRSTANLRHESAATLIMNSEILAHFGVSRSPTLHSRILAVHEVQRKPDAGHLNFVRPTDTNINSIQQPRS